MPPSQPALTTTPAFLAPSSAPFGQKHRIAAAHPASRSRRPRRFVCTAHRGDADEAHDAADASLPPAQSDWRAFRARLVRAETAPALPAPPAPPAPQLPTPQQQLQQPQKAQIEDESDRHSNRNTDGDNALSSTAWAHHVPFLERGLLLLASPDHFGGERRATFFAGAAVLLLEAGERDGSLGIVLNRPVGGGGANGQTGLGARWQRKPQRGSGGGAGAESAERDAGMGRYEDDDDYKAKNKHKDTEKKKSDDDEDVLGELAELSGSAVRLGGPVGLEAVFVVHDDETLGQRVSAGVQVGPFDEVVERLRDGRLDKARFFCGYAGWGSGQLEREVRDGAWIPCACSADVVMHDWPAGPSAVQRVLRLMGGEFAALAERAGEEAEGEDGDSSTGGWSSGGGNLPDLDSDSDSDTGPAGEGSSPT